MSHEPPRDPATWPRPEVLVRLEERGARHAVIEASAGTGKTFTLEHALVELLLRGVPLPRIVAVTFTERAAGELMERVRALLTRILRQAGREPPPPGPAWTIDARARERLQAALLQLDQAAIGTIHAFARRVLVQHALLLDRPLVQEPVDGQAAFAAAFGRVLRERLARQERGELLAWLSQGGVPELEALLLLIDRQRGALIRPRADPAALAAALSSLAAAARDGALEAAAREVEAARGVHASRRRAAGERLRRIGARALAWHTGGGGALGPSLDEELGEALGFLDRARRGELARHAPTAASVLELVGRARGARVGLAPAAAQLFLPPVQEQLRRDKRRSGAWDHDDLLELLRAALEGPQGEALAAALRRRWTHAIIDEFQDTDEAQWAVFRRVFAQAPPPCSLTVIGDPKQAIYAFRGADVFTYLRATRELQGGEPQRLLLSHRATPALVDALNAVFAGTPSFFGSEIRCEPLVSARSGHAARDAAGRELPPVHLFHFEAEPGGPSFRAGPLRALHARRIAAEARRLLRDGLLIEPRRAGESPRRVGPGDLFVLTRTRREGLEAAAALRAAGVPCALYKQEGLLQGPEAEDLHAVLLALVDPHDRSRRLRAWATPCFGLELEQLHGLGRVPGDHPLVGRLLAWRRLAARRAWGELAAALLEESGLARRERLWGTGARALTNWRHLLELLQETARAERLDLPELTRRLGAWIGGQEAPPGEEGVQRLERDAAAVQVMTMHKAKGLEAEVVFLYGGLSDPRGRGAALYHGAGDEDEDEAAVHVFHDPSTLARIVHVGPAPRAVLDRVRLEQEAEERRLLYVALTRARARLYLPSFGRQGRDWAWRRLGGAARPLAERLQALREGDGLDPALFQEERLTPAEATAPAPAGPELGRALRSWSPPRELLASPEPTLAAEAARRAALRRDPARAPLVLTSYSALRRTLEARALARAAGPWATPAADPGGVTAPPGAGAAGVPPRAPRAEPAPPLELLAGADAGSALHEVLERVDLGAVRPAAAEWAALPEVEEVVRRALLRHGLAPRWREACAALAHRALTAPLPLPGAGVLPGVCSLGPAALRELEFTYPYPEPGHPPLFRGEGPPLQLGRGHLRGFLDLVFWHQGRGWLLDWKSNRLPAYDPVTLQAVVQADYELQRRVYALALARMLGVASAEEHAARFGGVLFLFVRGLQAELPADGAPPPGVQVTVPGWEELLAWERELAGLEPREEVG